MDNQNYTSTPPVIVNLVDVMVAHIVQCVITAVNPLIDAKLDEALHDVRHSITELNTNAVTLNGEPLKKVIQTYVQDFIDDNRTLKSMDESIDNLSTRVDDLEDDGGSGFSRKLKDHIENVVQDKLDSSEFVLKDGLSEAVSEVISGGSFSFNRY